MIIQLPFVPRYPEQAEAVLGILKGLPSYVQPGVQIFRGPVDLHEQIPDDALAEYVNKNVPAEFVRTLHAPISDDNPDPRYSLMHPESEEMVLANLRVAERIGARSLTVHTNTVFTQGGRNPWTPKLDNYNTMAGRVRQPVYERLNLLARQSGVLIGVENMPLPIRGDKKTDPTSLLYEPMMTSFEDLLDFCDNVRCAGITYDTAHGELTRYSLNLLFKYLTHPSDVRETYFRGIYPGHFGLQPSVKEQLFRLLGMGRVVDVQLQDARSSWLAYVSKAEEGMLLGDGDLGEDIFEIAREINKHYGDVPVSIDVAEASKEEYISRPRQRESLRRLLEAIK
ncbi:MAG: hypothetical protein HY517_04650 [Candidatus Aenigmarchaeota archaeon]|nr:hypothetical protein [Candidatus Aenigmarchaeota archaeon]